MDYTPDVHFVESRANDRLGWHDCLAELIDNSFDAGATRAVISFARRSLSVVDDGQGTSDLRSMVRFGGHKKHKTTSLGCYGVGLKDAWTWLSNVIAIETSHGGQFSTLSVDVSKLKQLDSGNWIGPDPVVRESTKDERGTKISFGPLHANRTLPKADTFERLGRTFMPALVAGKQIVVEQSGKRTPIKAYKIPSMVESVEEGFEISGKLVSFHIGIAQDGERISKPGFCLCYGHRVLDNTTYGCGPYSSARMVGQIKLGVGWKLTPHKNDLSDHSDELENEIHVRIKHLLEKAEQIGEDIESRQLRTEIETGFNSALRSANGRFKRKPPTGDNPGTVLPKFTGKKHRAPANNDADANAAPRKRGIQLDWCTIEPHLLGQCDQLASRVLLNLDNDFIRYAKRTANKPALHAVAIGLFCHSAANTDGKQRFAFELKDFVGSWGTVMNSLHFDEVTNASH